MIRIGNEIINIHPFSDIQTGYHRVGFFRRGYWIEVLPTFNSITFGNIIPPDIINMIQTFNDVIDNDQVIRLDLDVLEERTRDMITTTLDRGIHLELDGDSLYLNIPEDSDVSEYFLDTIRIRDNRITTLGERIQPYIQSIIRIYHMDNIQFNREHHRSRFLRHVNRFFKIQRTLSKLYGIESNNTTNN